MSQAVSRRPLTAEARVQFQASPSEICGGRSGKWFSPSTSVYPVNNVPQSLYTYSFNHDRRYIILALDIVVKGRDNLEDLRIDGRIILKCIINRMGGREQDYPESK